MSRPYWRWLFKLLFLSICGWFAWTYWDNAVYSFRPTMPPLELGDVTAFTPDLIEHNSYVCIAGITEHRGMSQSVAQVLGQRAAPRWFFRLVGSRGVFVEVSADPEHFGPTQQVRVCGRAVDPARSHIYEPLMIAYQASFAVALAPPVRIIQADIAPGAHRFRYVIVMLGLLIFAGLQVWSMLRRSAQT